MESTQDLTGKNIGPIGRFTDVTQNAIFSAFHKTKIHLYKTIYRTRFSKLEKFITVGYKLPEDGRS